MPFGAQHGQAGVTLSALVPPRLAKNEKLHRKLAEGVEEKLVSSNGGPWQRAGEMPLDGPSLTALFVYIVRGLAFHHWKLILGDDHFVTAGYISEFGRGPLEKMLAMQAVQRVNVDLGNGVFVYEGVQLAAEAGLTLWRMSLYGAEVNGGPDAPHEKMKHAYGVSSRKGLAVTENFMRAMGIDGAA